jgi:lipid II:glycine glycyltransferase (peptidoglycan interpeptide bridge formation enzyme)
LQVELKRTELKHLNRGDNLFQSGFWGTFKARSNWKASGYTFRCDRGGGELLAFLREVNPDQYMAYVPYGPCISLPDSDQGVFLESLARSLRDCIPQECIYVRFDLPWETPYAAEPGARNSEEVDIRPPPHVREIRMNFGTRDWNLRKAPTDLLPSDTVMVDVSRSEQEMLARMKSKTRYNIRLAKRRGVRLHEGGVSDLPAWYRLYRRTAVRHGIIHDEPGHFQHLFRLARREGPGAPDLRLLLATHEGEVVAGIILALYGRRATYLYGASSHRKRHLMSTYRLQWKAMRLARERGCKTYDLFGIPPTRHARHPMHGLYRFKTGFGGRIFHRRGCWDYPFREALYRRCMGVSLSSEGFHRRRQGV